MNSPAPQLSLAPPLPPPALPLRAGRPPPRGSSSWGAWNWRRVGEGAQLTRGFLVFGVEGGCLCLVFFVRVSASRRLLAPWFFPERGSFPPPGLSGGVVGGGAPGLIPRGAPYLLSLSFPRQGERHPFVEPAPLPFPARRGGGRGPAPAAPPASAVVPYVDPILPSMSRSAG